MKGIVAALCCVLLACTTTAWKPAGPGDVRAGSEVFLVGADRAVQIRNAHPSGDRVQGDVVHMWRLPPGPMRVPMSSGDEPSDVARRGGWQEARDAPAVFDGAVADVDRVRVTQDSHIGRFLLGGLAAVAIVAAGLMAWTAFLGGRVRHTEIRPGETITQSSPGVR